jgi:hypothetical protein
MRRWMKEDERRDAESETGAGVELAGAAGAVDDDVPRELKAGVRKRPFSTLARWARLGSRSRCRLGNSRVAAEPCHSSCHANCETNPQKTRSCKRQRLNCRTLWLCTPCSFVRCAHSRCRRCSAGANTITVSSAVLRRRGHERVARVEWIREWHLNRRLRGLRMVWRMRRR